jgi:hypothetical protein
MSTDWKIMIVAVFLCAAALSVIYDVDVSTNYYGFGSKGRDGTIFEKKDTDKNRTIVVINEIHNYNELISQSNDVEVVNDSAYSLTIDEKGVCYINIIDPLIDYTPEVIGHAVSHCVWGDFHAE